MTTSVRLEELLQVTADLAEEKGLNYLAYLLRYEAKHHGDVGARPTYGGTGNYGLANDDLCSRMTMYARKSVMLRELIEKNVSYREVREFAAEIELWSPMRTIREWKRWPSG